MKILCLFGLHKFPKEGTVIAQDIGAGGSYLPFSGRWTSRITFTYYKRECLNCGKNKLTFTGKEVWSKK
jgi:hypothetical protein